MGGGDLLNLLIEQDLSGGLHPFSRCRGSCHQFSFIHHNVKPDVRSVFAIWDWLNLVSRTSFLILKVTVNQVT